MASHSSDASCEFCRQFRCCPVHCCDWDSCLCGDCDQCGGASPVEFSPLEIQMNRLDKSTLAASESAVMSSNADNDADHDWPLDSSDELQSSSLDAPSVPEVAESSAHSSNDVVKIRSGDGRVFYIPVSIASVSTVLAGMLVPGTSNFELLTVDVNSTIIDLHFYGSEV